MQKLFLWWEQPSLHVDPPQETWQHELRRSCQGSLRHPDYLRQEAIMSWCKNFKLLLLTLLSATLQYYCFRASCPLELLFLSAYLHLINPEKALPTTVPLNLTLPMWRMAERTFIISHTSESLNINTFMAERMSANSRASSLPSHVMLPPWKSVLVSIKKRMEMLEWHVLTNLNANSY